MKYLLALFLMFGLFACGDDSKDCDDCVEKGSVIISPDGEKVYKEVLKPTFPNAVPVLFHSVVKEHGFVYLYRRGYDVDKNCYMTRTLLDHNVNEYHEVYYSFRLSGMTESCIGQDCSDCTFLEDGGCHCKKVKGGCYYSVLNNRDIMRLF